MEIGLYSIIHCANRKKKMCISTSWHVQDIDNPSYLCKCNVSTYILLSEVLYICLLSNESRICVKTVKANSLHQAAEQNGYSTLNNKHAVEVFDGQ